MSAQFLKAFIIFTLSINYLSASNSVDISSIEKGQVLSSSYSAIVSDSQEVESVIENIYKDNFQKTDTWLTNGDFTFGKSQFSDTSVAKVASYAPNAKDSVSSPAITLPVINQLNEKIVLSYDESYELESSYDFGRVYISVDGDAWKSVHAVTGRNNKNTTSIDLSKYAGSTIQLKYVLTSDESYEFSGWEIGNISIDKTERYTGSTGSTYKSLAKGSTSGSLSAAFTSLNSQNFPYIYSSVNVSDETLSQSDFKVLENGVVQTDFFEVTPPASSSNSKLVDIVFIMDNSGSMSDEQSAVENNVISFVDALNASGIDYALGLCRYGQALNSGAPIAEDQGQLTTSGTYFKNTIWQRNIDDGGNEPAFDAIKYSMSTFAFRPGSQKIIILITDEQPDQGSVTDIEAVLALDNKSASINVLTLSTYYDDYDKFFLSEKNGFASVSTEIAPTSSTNAFLDAEETDYYKINITQVGSLTLERTSSFGSTYVYLYDADGNQLTYTSSNPFSYLVSPGTYYVGIKGTSTSYTGDYTLDSSFNASSTVAPTSSTNAFLDAGETDYYKINITQVGSLTLERTSSFGNTYVYLYDANGNQLTYTSSNPFSYLVSPGTYYVGIKGYYTSYTGDYTLNSSFTTTTTIAPTSSTNAFLDAGETDYYKINITQVGSLTLERTSSFGNTYVYLYDADGNQLTYTSSNPMSYSVVPGTYYVGIKGTSTSYTGNYTLDSSVTNTTTIAPTSSTNAFLDAGETDYYKINITQGGSLTLERTSSFGNTYAYLYDADGNQLTYTSNNPLSYFVIPGTYYVGIKGTSTSYTGDYTLDSSFTAATTIAPTSSNSDSLAGEMNYYKIEINQIGVLSVETDSSIDTYGYLYNAEGIELMHDDDDGVGNNFNISRLVFPGTYYIGVRDYGKDYTGDYTLNSSFTAATTIAPTSSTNAFLDAEETDYYKINITQVGSLTLERTSSFGNTYVYLYDADGNELTYTSSNPMSYSVFPGTYYVGIKGTSTSYTGGYILDSSITNTTTIAPTSSTNAFLDEGEVELYRVELVEDGILSVSTTGSLNTYGYLYDENGVELTSSSSGGDGSNFFISKVLTPGIYYIGVKGDYSSTTGNYSFESSFKPKSVLGSLYPITDPFEGILNDISSFLSSSYLVRYKSSNPNLDGTFRTVTIEVTDSTNTVDVTKSYIPGSAPIITRTAGTIAYESQSWAENTELSIDVIVTDDVAPNLSSVTLYYKNAMDMNYTSVDMNNSQGDVWTANIPSVDVLRPGVVYYVSATDGESTVTLPSSDVQSNPFSISILPNVAPVISDVSAVKLSNKDISISASVTDTTNVLEEVSLYYREQGDLLFSKLAMTVTGSGYYSAIIPASELEYGVEYYIYARDDFDVVTTYGTLDEPVFIKKNNINMMPILYLLLN